MQKTSPLKNFSQKRQAKTLVGVDEAGRGGLAGPVFASAVILNFPDSFKDSKSLTAGQREIYAQEIKKHHRFAVAKASEGEIESLNIHQASLLAMRRAVEKLGLKTGSLLIDGLFKIPGLPQFEQEAVVKGDQKVSCIAAASILAKTSRDEWLCKLDEKYPQYGFHRHKGYPTLQHKKAIQKYGPCEIHRKTFRGVREYC